MVIQICVGSSCHIKGSQRVVELMRQAVEDSGLQNDVTLAGSFCIGQCNREGVTVQIDGDICTGVTPEGFDKFFRENVLARFDGKRS